MRVLGLSSSLCSSAEKEEEIIGDSGLAPVYLNVYDLTPVNNYLYWFGLGIFHSGIEAHGFEYGYGAHEYSSSGVFEVEPRSCPGFIFRRSVLLGTTSMSRSDFRSFMEKLSRKYHGDTYHLIAKNCNHFTGEVCLQVTGKPVPGWINRMARVGSFCNCILPESIQLSSVRHPEALEFSDDNDGSEESVASSSLSDETDGEGSDHHLITAPNSDIAYLQDRPVRLARELLQEPVDASPHYLLKRS
uniref:DeSI-like protein n=1 Tax=Noccaea caerulescens TaxID=107243 RepID=A0A1J3IQR9_NOCCA